MKWKSSKSVCSYQGAFAVRTCGDVVIEYRADTYKFVTADYVVTEKDKEAVANAG